jgi:hypothetical protein
MGESIKVSTLVKGLVTDSIKKAQELENAKNNTRECTTIKNTLLWEIGQILDLAEYFPEKRDNLVSMCWMIGECGEKNAYDPSLPSRMQHYFEENLASALH